MNARTPITPAETEARQLAVDILAGDTQPYGRGGIYSAKEWQNAAQYLTDSDDCEELIYMMAQEEAAQEGDTAESWADEADYRYDLMREERMLAAWGEAA